MKKRISKIYVVMLVAFLITPMIIISPLFVNASTPPTSEINEIFGGAYDEKAYSIIETSDGGFVIAGENNTDGTGNLDAFLLKTDSEGNEVWSYNYGDLPDIGQTGIEWAEAVIECDNGDLVFAGTRNISLHGAINNFWLVRTNSEGDELWNKTYPYTTDDYAYSVVQTRDGGFAIAGFSSYYSGAEINATVIKTYPGGTQLWRKTYGTDSGKDYAHSIVEANDGNLTIAGYSSSYGTGSFDYWLFKIDINTKRIQWNRKYGTDGHYDSAFSVAKTFDGGYILTGHTDNTVNGDYDVYSVKTDSEGIEEWNEIYGGPDNDYAYSIVQTNDGGYAIAANEDFHVSPLIWAIKTYSNGTIEWDSYYREPCIGLTYSVTWTDDGGLALAGFGRFKGTNSDTDVLLVKTEGTGLSRPQVLMTYSALPKTYFHSCIYTTDGGYALVGGNYSGAGTPLDILLIKTDSNGVEEWNRTYGGINREWAAALVETSDGGFAIAGYTDSFGAGLYDMWLVRTNSTGHLLWSRTYGGENYDRAYSVIETVDGGFAIGGYTRSIEIGVEDYWLVRTNSTGHMLWNSSCGGASYDRAHSVIETSDGGFILAGYTLFDFGEGLSDVWLVKFDSSGEMVWNKTYGTTGWDYCNSVIETSDGGLFISAYKESEPSEEYLMNAWLIKTDSEGVELWNRTYGGPFEEDILDGIETWDGGYAIVGYYSYSTDIADRDMWIVKTDAYGMMEWNQTYGGAGWERGWKILENTDGSFTIGGDTNSFGILDQNMFLLKTIPPEPNTEVGENVEVVAPRDKLNVTFSEITEEGMTRSYITKVGPPPPAYYKLAGSLIPQYYEIVTSAEYSGVIEIAISYEEENIEGPEEQLKLMHQFENGTIQDITTSVDIVNNIIYGETTSLSLFFIVEPTEFEPPIITLNQPEPYGLYTEGLELEFSATDTQSGVDTVTGYLTNTSEITIEVADGYVPEPGVYTLTVEATDNVGNIATSEPIFFVVYDPDDGFATGGGWLITDEESTLPDGRANFGFVAKYKQGASTGNLQFQYQDADINLKSTSIDWLTIPSNKAIFQGTGTINGEGLYTFRVMATDNAEPGAGEDHFDIKIWIGTDTEADPIHKAKNTISGGNIKVHKK